MLQDPEVSATATKIMQRDKAFVPVFHDGKYPRTGSGYEWPLGITAHALARDFVWSSIIIIDRPEPVLPKDIRSVSERLSKRIGSLREVLTSGKLIAHGTRVAVGAIDEVDKLQWLGDGLLIDVRNSDLLEVVSPKPILKWSGLRLHLSSAEKLSDRALVRSSTVKKLSVERASIDAAIASLWSERIPPGIAVKVRDNMIKDWQKKNGRVVTSEKTIQRHLKLR